MINIETELKGKNILVTGGAGLSDQSMSLSSRM